MKETVQLLFEEQQAVELSNGRQLETLEKHIVSNLTNGKVAPDSHEILSIGYSLKDEIRPRGFNGSIGRIAVAPIVSPVDAFRSVVDRLGQGNKKTFTAQSLAQIEKSHEAGNLFAIAVTGVMSSTKLRDFGVTCVEAYYTRQTGKRHFGPVKRYMTKPTEIGGNVTDLIRLSRVIAQATEVAAIRKAEFSARGIIE